MANNSAARAACSTARPSITCWSRRCCLSDGSIATFREIARDEVPAGDTLEAACYRTVLRLASRACRGDRAAISRRSCGGSADTIWTSSRTLRKPVNLAKMMVGSEGTLGVVLEAKLRLVPLPKAKAVMVIEFADLLEALAATPVILRHGPSAIEVMDKIDPRSHAAESRRSTEFARRIIEGDPAATLCVEFYADRAEDLPPRLRALEEDLRARGIGYALSLRNGSGGAGAHLELAGSRAGAFDGDEGGREVDLVRRGHGGGAGTVERIYRAVSGIAARAWNHGGDLRACVGRDVCTCGR